MDIENIRDDIRSALAEVQRKHNVVITLGTITYSPTEFHCSLKAKIVDSTGSTYLADKAEWDRYCGRFGLLPSDFGARVTLHEGFGVVVGIKYRARKYPVAVRLASGKTYVCAAEVVIASRMVKNQPRNVTPVVAALMDMSMDSMENALK